MLTRRSVAMLYLLNRCKLRACRRGRTFGLARARGARVGGIWAATTAIARRRSRRRPLSGSPVVEAVERPKERTETAERAAQTSALAAVLAATASAAASAVTGAG